MIAFRLRMADELKQSTKADQVRIKLLMVIDKIYGVAA